MEYRKLIIWILVTAIMGLFFNACNQPPQEDVIQLDYEQNHSVTYKEAIDKYRKLDNASDMARLLEAGETDAGKWNRLLSAKLTCIYGLRPAF